MEIKKSKSAFILFIISLAASCYFWICALKPEPLLFDQFIDSLVSNTFLEQTLPFFHSVTELGSKLGIGSVALLLILWLWIKKKDYIGMGVTAVAVGVGNELNKLIKDITERPRRESEYIVQEMTSSFPSGHAMVGIILYMFVIYFLIKDLNNNKLKWMIGIPLSLVVFLIGISRIILQAHYPSDVFGGFAIGFVWAYLLLLIYEAIRSRKKR